MTDFNPKKLFVEYKNDVTIKNFKLPRKYTLTHSDETGDLFLTIGKKYDYEKIGPLRDEVLAQWREDGGKKYVEVFLHIDGKGGLVQTIIRDSIFRKELPLALTAIFYGDGLLIENDKELENAVIEVNFKSKIPEYNVKEKWGTVKDYKYEYEREENIKKGFYPKPYPPYPYPNPPIPPFIPIPNPIPLKPQGKCKITEEILITMLDPYIENKVNDLFGRKTPYCLKRAEILDARVIGKYEACTNEYMVTIGVRVGKNPPPYNNLIMEFIINKNIVKVVDVKTPRGKIEK